MTIDTTGFATVRMHPTQKQVQDVLERVNQADSAAYNHVSAQPDFIPTVPASQTMLEDAIKVAIPAVLAAVQPIIAARKVTVATATTLITVISQTVADVAPRLRGADARALVVALFGWVFDTYLAPMMPVWLRPFAGFIKSAAIGALETAYRAVVQQKG